ncbi:MAG TPA: hypothetical protein VM935_15495, partial [Chitinophagaceae bacterium]|nr:hypothetical protein [Chitinophagaceae bacterium]
MKKIYFILLSAICFFAISCSPKEESRNITASAEKRIDTTAGSSPYLTKDNKGNLVLSWVKEVDSSHFILCYSVSKDGGTSFDKAIEIPASTNVHPHGENMPKMIFKSS